MCFFAYAYIYLPTYLQISTFDKEEQNYTRNHTPNANMETVNNIAAAASKVIWGEPQETTDAANATIVPETKGTEPISGELGDTKKGEPYDLGNAGMFFCLFV